QRMDVYISPHSDDICFSLGVLAHTRCSGILLTVCSVSSYVAQPGTLRMSPAQVTRIRTAEDLEFAAACGLRAHFMNAEDALLLGHHPFDLRWAEPNAIRIEPALTKVLCEFSSQNASGRRPWLF